jgi:hypothetical protein
VVSEVAATHRPVITGWWSTTFLSRTEPVLSSTARLHSFRSRTHGFSPADAPTPVPGTRAVIIHLDLTGRPRIADVRGARRKTGVIPSVGFLPMRAPWLAPAVVALATCRLLVNSRSPIWNPYQTVLQHYTWPADGAVVTTSRFQAGDPCTARGSTSRRSAANIAALLMSPAKRASDDNHHCNTVSSSNRRQLANAPPRGEHPPTITTAPAAAPSPLHRCPSLQGVHQPTIHDHTSSSHHRHQADASTYESISRLSPPHQQQQPSSTSRCPPARKATADDQYRTSSSNHRQQPDAPREESISRRSPPHQQQQPSLTQPMPLARRAPADEQPPHQQPQLSSPRRCPPARRTPANDHHRNSGRNHYHHADASLYLREHRPTITTAPAVASIVNTPMPPARRASADNHHRTTSSNRRYHADVPCEESISRRSPPH